MRKEEKLRDVLEGILLKPKLRALDALVTMMNEVYDRAWLNGAFFGLLLGVMLSLVLFTYFIKAH